MRRVVILVSLPLLAVVAVGCRHDGRTLRPANPNQDLSISTTTQPPSTTVGSSGSTTTGLDNPSLGTDAGTSTTGG